MGHTPHELHEEFPGQAGKITELKTRDTHFAETAEVYHELNRTIHRIESGLDAVADAVLEDLKKKRLALKDEISGLLAKA
ncbi:MAG: DUF465 domain-containing protein [Caulobacteraceae bacterium]|nr:DUF465 domain-containing protein [Caulobacteraceae bacterium]